MRAHDAARADSIPRSQAQQDQRRRGRPMFNEQVSRTLAAAAAAVPLTRPACPTAVLVLLPSPQIAPMCQADRIGGRGDRLLDSKLTQALKLD